MTTDAEKTAVLVERLFGGKWPGDVVVENCVIFGTIPHDLLRRSSEVSHRFDPFTRIEDAFAVVERLVEKMAPNWWLDLDGPIQGDWQANIHKRDGYVSYLHADTPQRAIAEAAYLAVTAP